MNPRTLANNHFSTFLNQVLWYQLLFHIYTCCRQQTNYIFFWFFSKPTETKSPKRIEEFSEHNRSTVFPLIDSWCQLSLLFFILSSLYFITICSNSPYFVLPITMLEYVYPPSQQSITKRNNLSSLNADKYPTTAETLLVPPWFQRHILWCICCRLRKMFPFPLTSAIRCRHHWK